MSKFDDLVKRLKSMGKVAVAFSGGVDSTFLLKVAHDVLGDNAFAITARLVSMPEIDCAEAEDFCRNESIRHIQLDFDELAVSGYAQNPPNRCYLCKSAVFKMMKDRACSEGAYYLLEGSNIDDLGDYRPGMAAIQELEICSPLMEAHFSKADIRYYARELGLEVWNKPSCACLSSRIPYGGLITKDKLRMVEQAEKLLRDMGFEQVRVRLCDKTARIEVLSQDICRITSEDNREYIANEFKKLGFVYVSVDLDGYRTGSMNEVIGEGRANGAK